MNEIQLAIDRLMTCARAFACQHEEACFLLAQWAREQFEGSEVPVEVPQADESYEPN